MLMPDAAEAQATVVIEPTPSERVADVLWEREEHSQDFTLTPAQERAEHVAGTARKVRENRGGARVH